MAKAKSGISIKPSHKGLLHKKLGVPQGQKIPQAKIKKAESSGSASLRKEASFADTAEHKFHHAGKVTSVSEHSDGQHVEVHVQHGRRPDNSKPNTAYKESKTSRVVVPKAMAKHFPVGGAVRVGISPAQGPTPPQPKAAAPKGGRSAIRAAFGK